MPILPIHWLNILRRVVINILTLYQYDGATQYSYVADNGALCIAAASGTEFWITGWGKANPDGVTEYYFGKNTAAATNGRYGFFKASNDEVTFIAQPTGGAVQIVTGIDGDVDTADWFHSYLIDIGKTPVVVD